MNAYRGIRSLRDPTYWGPWVYRITRNAALDQWRLKARREKELYAGEIQGELQSPHFEIAEVVHRGLARLPEPKRDMLTLFYLEGLSIEEMAGVLSIPTGTVKSRLHNAKRALRSVLEKREAGDEG